MKSYQKKYNHAALFIIIVSYNFTSSQELAPNYLNANRSNIRSMLANTSASGGRNIQSTDKRTSRLTNMALCLHYRHFRPSTNNALYLPKCVSDTPPLRHQN